MPEDEKQHFYDHFAEHLHQAQRGAEPEGRTLRGALRDATDVVLAAFGFVFLVALTLPGLLVGANIAAARWATNKLTFVLR